MHGSVHEVVGCIHASFALLHSSYLIAYNKILGIGKRWQDAWHCGQVICVDDALLRLHELSYALLQVQMYIDGSIEASGTT